MSTPSLLPPPSSHMLHYALSVSAVDVISVDDNDLPPLRIQDRREMKDRSKGNAGVKKEGD